MMKCKIYLNQYLQRSSTYLRQAALQKRMANLRHERCPFAADNRRLLFDNRTHRNSILDRLSLAPVDSAVGTTYRRYAQVVPQIVHLKERQQLHLSY